MDEDLSPRTGSRRFTYEVARLLQMQGHEVKIFTTKMDRGKCFREYLSMPIEIVSDKEETKFGSPTSKFGISRTSFAPLKKNIFIKSANNFFYRTVPARLALKISEKIAESRCEATLFQYHGEHWLLPYFYHLPQPTGVTYLNVVPPQPRPLAHPWQELTLYYRMMETIFKLPPVGSWEKLSFRKLALFMTPSRFQLKQAMRLGIIRQKKTEVVPLGVDHSEFFSTGEEEPFALYLGRIHPYKSLELAVMSMKNTSSKYSLVIAGDITERNYLYKDKLVSLAQKMKISERFKMVLFPSDSEVVRLMQRCSAFLFPSTFDTFGLVVLEAMACGKPVVACNRGGVPEIVGKAGFLIEPNVIEWQSAVAKLLSDSTLRHKMGKEALKRSENFSWEKTTENLLAAFGKLK